MAKFNFQYSFPHAKAVMAVQFSDMLRKALTTIPAANTATRAQLKATVAVHRAIAFPDWMGVKPMPEELGMGKITSLKARQQSTAEICDVAAEMRQRLANHEVANAILDTMVQKLQARQVKWFESNGFNGRFSMMNDVYLALVSDMMTMLTTAADTAQARLEAKDGKGLTSANLRDFALVINVIKAVTRGSQSKTPKAIVVPTLTTVKAREDFLATLKRSSKTSLRVLNLKALAKKTSAA